MVKYDYFNEYYSIYITLVTISAIVTFFLLITRYIYLLSGDLIIFQSEIKLINSIIFRFQ